MARGLAESLLTRGTLFIILFPIECPKQVNFAQEAGRRILPNKLTACSKLDCTKQATEDGQSDRVYRNQLSNPLHTVQAVTLALHRETVTSHSQSAAHI